MFSYILAILGVAIIGGFAFNRSVALRYTSALENTDMRFHSQSIYYGYLTAWSIAGIGGVICIAGLFLEPFLAKSIFNPLWLFTLILSCIGVTYVCNRLITPEFRARTYVERCIIGSLIALSTLAVLTTLGIIISLLFESLRFFNQVPISEFLFGTQWSPQTALRLDQAGQSGSFGAVSIFSGTLLIMILAMCIAGPIGLMIAIYLSEYASNPMRRIVKPLLEILAGIPPVVYGFFALMTVGPAIHAIADNLGVAASSQSALSAGLVLGLMIIPLVSSLSDDVINAVPQDLRDGSYALGATKSETMKTIIFTAALPGIIGAFLLAISRAIGETMIVVMAAGRAANLTANPFEAVTTVTVQIVTLLTGDQEFDSPKTLAAFSLGLVLFLLTLVLNMIALAIVRKYRERYN